jgi:hypothetical protein
MAISTVTVKSNVTTVKASSIGIRGRTGLVWRSAWSGTVNYYLGDAVSYEGSSYVNIKYIAANSTAYPDVETNYWQLLASKGDQPTSTNLSVTSHNNLPSGSLQAALEYLEDRMFNQSATPTGSSVVEGDLWYDTSNDRMFVYRNNTWELLVTSSATSSSTGYDSITMNGGYW